MKLNTSIYALAVLRGVTAKGWEFVEKGTSGVVGLETIIVSPTLALFLDVATNVNPLTVNGHPAWGALLDLETHQITALDVVSDTFCASGALLSNGSMVCELGKYD
jgi:hypothetical protein